MAYRIDPGRFTTRILIEQPTVTKGAAGGMQKAWSPLGGMWCQVRHHSGTERRATKAGGGEVAVASTEFVGWWRPDITPQMRINLGGVYYDIQHVNNVDQEGVYVILTGETGAGNG